MQTNQTDKKKLMEEAANRKEFRLTSFSIDNRISVLILILLVFIIGLRSYLSIPKEAAPDVTIPNILVITTYPGVSPVDMESLITRKLEDELSNISDIKLMTSVSAEGYSSINLEFEVDVNIEEALQKVRERVDLARPDLPSDAEDPIIMEINISEFPIMQVNIAGDYGMDELKRVAERLEDRFEAIPQVLEVDLTGALEREVKVDVDLARLKYYGLSFSDIVVAIQNENITVPGGTIDVGTRSFLLRVPGEYEDPLGLGDIVIDAPDRKPIYLRDVAEVTFGHKDRTSWANLDGSQVVTLNVKKRVGANLLETADAVRAVIEQESPALPPTTEIHITNDQSRDIRVMVSSLENNIISGLLLVIGVLLFFMGVRNSSFVGISIPMSMFMTFIILQAIGVTMNMIVLFALILALGMLVDNAIVVVENIYRYLEEGFDNITAAKKGTGEVAFPIISGTATTLAAFLPIVFWPGVVGDFMSYLPITVIVVLSSSLFVGLVINPVLCAVFMKLEQDETEGEAEVRMTRKGKRVLYVAGGLILFMGLLNNWVSWTMLLVIAAILILLHHYMLKPLGRWWQENGVEWLLARYERFLKWSLDHSVRILGSAVLVLFSSFILFGMFNAGVEFFPENIPPARLYAQIEAPAGSTVEFTKQIVDEIERRVDQLDYRGDIETVLATAGAPIASGFDDMGGDTENRGTVVLNFVEYQLREGNTFDVMEQMRDLFPVGIAGAEVTIEQPQEGPPTGKPINLEISGPDMAELKRLSEEVISILENHSVYSKLDGLENDLPDPRSEMQIVVDREKAALLGLSTFDVGNTIRQAMNGVEASQYRDGNDEYDITVRLAESYRENFSTLGDLTIQNEDGFQIPLSEVATWQSEEGFGGIRRKDQRRLVTVSADVRATYNSNAVLQEVQEVLRPWGEENLPTGYTMEWTGQMQEQNEAQDFLTTAFLIALGLIAFILVSQFNSVAKPVIILTSVIMSIAGVLYGLILFRMPFGIIMTGIGVISLAGVVVNNAIVLIDYADLLRSRDRLGVREALIQAGLVRFRPVILTAITTILGLVPLATGFNFDFFVLVNRPVEFFSRFSEYVFWGGEQAAWWSPMAIAVICGLLFATFLTLLLVPVLYYVIENNRRKTNLFFFGTPEPDLLRMQEGVTNGAPVAGAMAEENR